MTNQNNKNNVNYTIMSLILFNCTLVFVLLKTNTSIPLILINYKSFNFMIALV